MQNFALLLGELSKGHLHGNFTLLLVQAALDRVQTYCTTIVVAHRLSTIRNADSIAVLQEGKILEQGSHNVLVQQPRGAYRALVNQQQRAI